MHEINDLFLPSIMAPGLWISVIALLAGYFICPSRSLVGTNTLGTELNSNSVTSANHSNNNSEKLGESPYWMTMDHVVANDSSDREAEHHGVHIANWRWDEIGVFFTFAVFIIVSGLAKVGKLLWIHYIYYGGTVLVCAYSVSIVFGTVGHFNSYLPTPWNRVLLEKLVKKFPAFLEPEGSSPYSQVPATCPYHEPTLSSPHNFLPLPEDQS